MSINKNAYLRYHVLDNCFRNPYKRHFIQDLLLEVNTSMEEYNGLDSSIQKRQLYDDIKFMESNAGFSAPIVKHKEGRKVYYTYSDKNFSIKNQKITDDEINIINDAMIVFQRFSGLPQFEWINELATKLRNSFDTKANETVISFDHNEYLIGLNFLPRLYQSILQNIPLEIQYQSFKNPAPKIYTISPYYLKQYNKRWFLFGIEHNDNYLYNLPLDRIKSIKNTDKEYIPNNSTDFNEYFEDIIGVSRKKDDVPIKIKIRFTLNIVPYVITKPLHGSQKKIDSNDKGVVFEYNLIPNIEFKRRILRFGKDCELIAPLHLKEDFMDEILNMKRVYTESIL